MIFNLPWLPEFYYFESKIKNPVDLFQGLDFIRKEIYSEAFYESNETIFWVIVLLHQLDQLNLINEEAVLNHILSLKHQDGGFLSSDDAEEPDTWSTFFCIATLKILGQEGRIDDKDADFLIQSQISNSNNDGGFIHCKSNSCHLSCGGKVSAKSTFFALSALRLLNKIEMLNKELLIKHITKPTSDNFELIYKYLSLKVLEDKANIVNLEEKISKMSIWQIPESGSKFPSIEYTLWSIISLGMLENLELIDYGGMFDFIKSMQKENGGFTEQYSSLTSQEPNLLSSVLGLICIFYIWGKLINEIENDILYRAQDSSNVYFNPISNKFSVPQKLVKKVAKWMITNKWLTADILDNKRKFIAYIENQTVIPHDIIDRIMRYVRANPTVNTLDLSEFSKNFDFSNALERVKLVINDLIINEFLIGNIKHQKKKYSGGSSIMFDDFLMLEQYLHTNGPIPYIEIINEKKKIFQAGSELLSLESKSINLIEDSTKILENLIEEEKIFEAKRKLNETLEEINTTTREFKDLMNRLKDGNHFVNSRRIINQFENYWPDIDAKIEGALTSFRTELVETIQKKEDFIIQRAEDTEDQKSIKHLEDKLSEILEKLDKYKIDIDNFFLENYTNSNATLELIKFITTYIEKCSSELDDLVVESIANLHFPKYKKNIQQIETYWKVKRQESKENLSSYQIILEKRMKLESQIDSLVKELQDFIDNNYEQVIHIVSKNKLDQSYVSLNRAINIFNNLMERQEEAIDNFIIKTKAKISEFPKLSNDIKLEGLKRFKEAERTWNKIVLELRKEIHDANELAKKEVLRQDLTSQIKEIKKSQKNYEDTVENLITSRKLDEAQTKTNEIFLEITQQIKDYNQKFKNFIRESISDFKTFRETVKDLSEEWAQKKKELNLTLKEIKDELDNKREQTDSAIKEAGIQKKRNELDENLKENIAEIELLIKNFKETVLGLIESEKINEAKTHINAIYSDINQKIKTYDQEFKNYVKESTLEHKTFRESVKDLIGIWDMNKKDLSQSIANIKNDLKGKSEKKSSKLKTEAMLERKAKLEDELHNQIKIVENLSIVFKNTISDLIDSKEIDEAEERINELFLEISDQIKNYNREFKDYIKASVSEFKDFRENVNDLIELWAGKKEVLTLNLNDIKKELEEHRDITGSNLKKNKLRTIIKTQISELEIEIYQFESNYEHKLKSDKDFEKIESDFLIDYADLQGSLRALDNQVKSIIKSASKAFHNFDEKSEEEQDFWNNSKISAEEKLNVVYEKIQEDLFINKVKFFAKAFKDRKIDLVYLSKVMKVKLKALKLRLIDLISNLRLDGEIDSVSDMFFLKAIPSKEVLEEKKRKLVKEKPVEEEIDPIKKDILSLRYIMIVHNNVGASLYSRKLGDWEMDPHLIGGFLTAMQDFSAEIKQRKIPMKSMAYKEFEILIEQGNYIFIALFVDGKGSEWIRDKLRLCVEKFENSFAQNLKDWKGELSMFGHVGFLIDDVFELFKV